ncbi:Hypothetical Protein FCC1311_114302 [Hondaea fermentalgiana]|uniref:Uncharacterized protein n=1 Tax=Hondaea fermentalgiana TaxID=2315210 RepID=A0A2R5GWJ7_9STRA|nr:Hypothetical Protein FCC1311_114302 [Hondaea fermentalgiana]|eukprot:GBG35207.1 Hypothetical Protein FCC1311_114302 [Hondaea fermentalgiana]
MHPSRTIVPGARKTAYDEIEEVVSTFMEMNPTADRDALVWLCRIYFRDSDKKGFVYPFDELWPVLGYSAKNKAKRATLETPPGGVPEVV